MRLLSPPLRGGFWWGGIAALAALLLLAGSRPAGAVPAFARQTDQPCTSCHIGAFGPQLTPFGIAFKMSGYTLTAGETSYPYIPLSAMLLTSFNNTADPVQKIVSPNYGTNNNYNLDQVSLFLAGALSSYAGGLIQMTYNGTSGSAFLDDSDLRLTHAFDVSTNEVRIGLDLNDGPTVQDPYNTLYHYAYPYASSAIAPAPVTAPIALSALAGNSLGITNYYWINQTWYFEVGGYKSLSATWDNALGESINNPPIGRIEGVAPYVRLAWQKIWGNNFLEVGGVLFGAALAEGGQLAPTLMPGTNDYYDYGIDMNYQYQSGNHTFAIATNLLQQQMNLGASYASGLASKEWNNLTQFRIMGDYYYKNTYGFTLAFNDTFGSHDALLYAPAPIVGSADGSPNYKALTAEIDWVPFGKSAETVWDFEKNLKIGLQYTAYFEFNGGTTNFDGYGHNASGMNTLYLYAWLAW